MHRFPTVTTRPAVPPLSAVALVLVAVLAACGDSLVDHAAGAAVLHPSSCAAGQVLCGASCVPEDAGHCGAACSSCASAVPPDPNAAPVCTEAHACAFECRPGWLRVGDGCQRATAISAGFAHTCAITTGGNVKCWGANDQGQLGDGTTRDSPLPVDVVLPSRATALAAGYVHTCVVAGGAAYCWGDNSTGALGDGTTIDRDAPVRVPGIAGASVVSAGGGEDKGTVATFYGHSCAIAGGSVWCWGSNESGQLGDGSLVQRTTPGPVALGSFTGQVTSVVNGDRHTCAIAAGTVWCWGAAGSWQLGDGGTTNQPRPIEALGLPGDATSVSAGAAHTCAAIASSPETLWCWGSNSAGQAAGGDNSQLTVQRPTALRLPVAPTQVSAGAAHTCVADGTVLCFGANDASQLSGPATARGAVAVALPRPVRALAAGYDHTCALLDDGSIECWGANARGQLGAGTAGVPAVAPLPVSGR